ncbi:hypothetical protein Aco03nite_008380 [Actinoplanes couchii]|uniref:Transmembrane protein n=1 Tax=Actinoplanes couchii TaxID=403638 RepID=A0ABQ3X1N3_9ACTN|nr:hypothetical protein Aco03nite_008380 [Actinoplanes couchii]
MAVVVGTSLAAAVSVVLLFSLRSRLEGLVDEPLLTVPWPLVIAVTSACVVIVFFVSLLSAAVSLQRPLEPTALPAIEDSPARDRDLLDEVCLAGCSVSPVGDPSEKQGSGNG